MNSRIPPGTIRDQICKDKQNNISAPSDWHCSFCPSQLIKEDNHIRIQDHYNQFIAAILCASKPAIPRMSKTDGHCVVNKVTARNKSGNRFDGSNSAYITGSNLKIYWTCPKCHAQWRRNPEHLVNLEQNGRYFFGCSSQDCDAWLVVTEPKDNTMGELSPVLAYPSYTEELCRHRRGASRAACTRRIDDTRPE